MNSLPDSAVGIATQSASTMNVKIDDPFDDALVRLRQANERILAAAEAAEQYSNHIHGHTDVVTKGECPAECPVEAAVIPELNDVIGSIEHNIERLETQQRRFRAG